jgi:hypothetical protein
MSDYSPFKVGDILRERYTQDYFLIVEQTSSERTGHAVSYYVKALNNNRHFSISWLNFNQYIVEG